MAKEMEPTTTQQEPNGSEPTPQGEGTDWKAMSRKWEARAKESNEKLKDYEELKAKAARLDEIENANKSEFERISEQAAQAQSTAEEWKSKYEALEAQRQHELDVRKAAQEYGVDADVLIRMGGNVDENAQFLKARDDARPKFGDMRDGGEQNQQPESLEERLASARNEQERIRIRAEFNAKKRN